LIVVVATLALTCGALSTACGGGQSGRKVSFSADQITILGTGGRKIRSRFYWAPGKLRIETKSPGRPGGDLVTIVRKDPGRAWIVLPAMKQYHEISLSQVGSAQLVFKPAPDQIVEKLGTETVAGYRCEKLVVRGGGPEGNAAAPATMWVSAAFPVPLKIRTARGDVTEYHNIEVGPQPAELFELPQGYTEMARSMPLSGGHR